jgi:gamma-glutamyltranspeptidase / glutathione hydrolase
VDDLQVVSASGTNGAVAAAHPLAVEAGLDALRAGGNAVDAAVATAFALSVVDPPSTSLGGRGSALIFLAGTGRLFTLDFNTVCPAKASAGVYDVVPTRPGEWWSVRDFANDMGPRAVSVPTNAAGFCAAAERYGRLPLPKLVESAARIAEEGFAVHRSLEMSIAASVDRLGASAGSRAVFMPNGRPLRRGERCVSPDLARSLRAIGAGGASEFYRGAIADAILRDSRDNGGLLCEADLADYVVSEATPAITSYRGLDVAVTARCTGGPTVLEALNILERFSLPAGAAYEPRTVHLGIEALKLAWADRFAYVADPAFVPVPLDGLISKIFAAERAGMIDELVAAQAPAAGDPWRYSALSRAASVPVGPGQASPETTYCCAVDSEGNAVSMTHTLCGGFGSGVTVPGTGILLNNGMKWFDPRPGSPNSIVPGKTPLNNQDETIVLRDGRPLLVIGSPGGRRLMTTIFVALSRIIDHGFSVSRGLAAPRLHVEDAEPTIFERDWQESIVGGMELLLALKAMGHGLATLPITERYISGPAHGIAIDSASGLEAAGDPRHPSAAGAI